MIFHLLYENISNYYVSGERQVLFDKKTSYFLISSLDIATRILTHSNIAIVNEYD